MLFLYLYMYLTSYDIIVSVSIRDPPSHKTLYTILTASQSSMSTRQDDFLDGKQR